MNVQAASVESRADSEPLRDWRPARPLVFATFLAPAVAPVYSWIAEHAGATLRCDTSLVVGSSLNQVVRGEVDVAFICGLPYVWLADQRPSPIEILAAPVLKGRRYGGRPIYFSDVIARADRPFRSFADLRGRSWSYNERSSYSGYLATLDHLVCLGETDGFFGRVVKAGAHLASVRMVVSGEIDASAIDSQVLGLALAQDPGLRSSLRVVATYRSAPIQPVVAGRHLSADVRAALRKAILSAASDPVGRSRFALGGVARFEAVDDRHYDPIRRREQAVKAAGFKRIR